MKKTSTRSLSGNKQGNSSASTSSRNTINKNPPPTNQSKTSKSTRHENDKIRKASEFEDQPKQDIAHRKRLKKMKDFEEIDDEANNISIQLSPKSKRTPSAKNTSADKEDIKRPSKENSKSQKKKIETGKTSTLKAQTPKKDTQEKPTSRRAASKKMEIEEDTTATDETESFGDLDYTPSPKRKSKKESTEGLTIGQITKKYNKTKPIFSINKDSKDEEDEDEKKTKKKSVKGNKSKTTMSAEPETKPKKSTKKVSDLTSQGPLSGNTIVVTGEFDQISRPDLEDLLKSLGARVTASVSGRTTIVIYGIRLEDGRPVNTSKKYRTAEEKKIKLMSETEFDDFLFKKNGTRLVDGLSGALSQLSIPTQQSDQIQPIPLSQLEKSKREVCNTLWTHKYAPKKLEEIVGNQGFIKEIMNWLTDWDSVVFGGEKKEAKFKPGRSRDSWSTSNVNARACLISGPPGIGKTTAVRVIARTMGYELIERNASDVRNKATLEKLLGSLKDNELVQFTKKGDFIASNKFIILMDEVDGMSAGDRGGSRVLIDTIKVTKHPIICICNDRQHPKIRTLANYCYDIKFHRPNKQHVAKRVAEICNAEGLRVDANSLEYLCENFGNDFRQILNFLQMYAKKAKALTFMDAKGSFGQVKKDETVMMNNFEAAKKIMSSHHISLREKVDLFFIDYDLIPLLVQENYLPLNPKATTVDLEKVAKAADLISTGDILNKTIRTEGEWSLMPNFAFLSAIYPSELVNTFIDFPRFPEWLGKNSSQKKRNREIRELRIAMAPIISGNRNSVLFDYVQPISEMIHFNMKDEDIDNVIEIMDHYELTPDMVKEHIVDLQLDRRDPLMGVPTQTKAALTKAYNNRHKTSIKTKKAKRVAGAGGEGEGHRFNPEAEEEEQVVVEEHEGEEGETGEDRVEVEEVLKKGKEKKNKGKDKEGAGKKKK